MNQYNLELFDKDLNNIHFEYVSIIPLDNDYLAPQGTNITIYSTNKIDNARYIYIRGCSYFFGVISSINYQDHKTTLNVKPFLTLFDIEVIFNTDFQGSELSLEDTLKHLIEASRITSSDLEQNIPNLIIKTISETKNWGFNLKSDFEGLKLCKINLYSVLIKRSLLQYGVCLNATPDFNTKKIYLSIGKSNVKLILDTNLDTIKIKDFTINKMSENINKLYVTNAETLDTITFFLHTDGSFDNDDRDRILPVIWDIKIIKLEENQNFIEEAVNEATLTYSNISWSTYIEIEDFRLDPDSCMDIKFGQEFDIFYNGRFYIGVLTAIKINKSITYIFGTTRKELTKKKYLEKGGE